MNILTALFRPQPAPVRYIVANRQESRKAQTARIHTELQLAVSIAQLTPEQRREAVQRASVRLPLREKA
jgi:hypothetical protein